MSNIVNRIKNSFINESINSPMLLSDLAQMEKYIAESYSGRSLIELLQNADDAGSTEFYLQEVDNNTFIVANNGRLFDENDLIALCRSGASTKKRKSNTIGFRGVGFKSVVNYAEEVYLFSGEHRVVFSKQLTKQALKTSYDVPLIRIPHQCESSPYDLICKDLLRRYNTIFVFNIKKPLYKKEIQEFDESCLIFLRNIQKVIFSGYTQVEYFANKKNVSEKIVSVSISNAKLGLDEWYVYSDMAISKYASIAFKINNGFAIPADITQSVVHSFMPTRNKLSIPFKINGDFSTDPSRTSINLDEETYSAIKECSLLIKDILQDIYNSDIDKYGFLEILSKAQIDPLSHIKGESVNDILVKYLKEITKNIYGEKCCTQPVGILESDFLNICSTLNIKGVINKATNNYLSKFLTSMGLGECSLIDCLKAANEIVLSETSRVEILAKTISKTRFGIDANIEQVLKKAQLFSVGGEVLSISQMDNSTEVNSSFLELLFSKINGSLDYVNFAIRHGIKAEEQKAKPLEFNVEQNNPQTSKIKKYAIPKWRTVEKNVCTLLESMPNVKIVRDVSEQNLGYDIEVLMNDGKKQYYEVKSVEYLGASISITNNEYSTANQYGNNYFLAIANQTNDEIEVCFVQNPIQTLSLAKRAIKWEWICCNYNGQIIKKQFDI